MKKVKVYKEKLSLREVEKILEAGEDYEEQEMLDRKAKPKDVSSFKSSGNRSGNPADSTRHIPFVRCGMPAITDACEEKMKKRALSKIRLDSELVH